MTEQNTEMISLPAAKFVLVPVVVALLINAAIAAAVAVVWPDKLGSVGLGALAAVVGLGVGAMAIGPWKPRAKTAWPTVVLAGHGVSMLLVTLAAVSLYSSARPDAPAFLASVALPFPLAMIAQARLVLGPALGVTTGDGRSARTNP